MNDAVNDACQRENASNDAAHADEELEEVFFRVGVHDGEGRDLVVENDQALEGLEFGLVRGSQLKHFVSEEHFVLEDAQHPTGEFAQEDGRHCFDVETHAHVLLTLGHLALKPV